MFVLVGHYYIKKMCVHCALYRRNLMSMRSACHHHFQLHLLIHVILIASFKGIIKQLTQARYCYIVLHRPFLISRHLNVITLHTCTYLQIKYQAGYAYMRYIQIGFQMLDDKKNSAYIWYTYQYLYLWYPVETTVEERVCKKTSDVQSKKVKVQPCYTPSPKVKENLYDIV